MNEHELIKEANYLRRTGCNELADPLYDKALLIEPNNIEFLFNKAMNIWETQPEKALALYEKVIAIDPDHEVTYENIFVLAIQKLLCGEAIDLFDKCLAINHSNNFARYHKALILSKCGDYLNALLEFYWIIDDLDFYSNPKSYFSAPISKDIETCKILLHADTQDLKPEYPIYNKEKILESKIKLFEYPLPFEGEVPANYFLDFGKYMGLSIKEVLNRQPDYIFWCIINLNNFCVSEEVIEILHKKGFINNEAESINLFKILNCGREQILKIKGGSPPPDEIYMDEDGNIKFDLNE